MKSSAHLSENNLIITPVPALVAILLAREKEKAAPLVQEEVEDIVRNTECITMPRHAREKVDAVRGYTDIDPEHAWEQWQQVRKDLL